MKAIFTILFLLSAALSCFAQEKPQAVLIGESGKVYCDQFGAIVGNFLYTVQEEPGSFGYAVIYSRGNLSGPDLNYLNAISDVVYSKKFDPARIKIIRAKKDVEIEIKFWKVPAGAASPVIEGPEWPDTFPSSRKPFVFTVDSDSGRSICYGFAPQLYADFLHANPRARGHIVVYDDSAKKARKAAAEKLKLLSGYDIQRSRLRVFYAKPPKNYLPFTEFWLIPAGKEK